MQRHGPARSGLAAYIERHPTNMPQRTAPSCRQAKHENTPLDDLGFGFKQMKATSGTINFSIEF